MSNDSSLLRQNITNMFCGHKQPCSVAEARSTDWLEDVSGEDGRKKGMPLELKDE